MIPQIFDKNILRLRDKRFESASASVLLKEVQKRLIQRLGFFKNRFKNILTHGMEGSTLLADNIIRLTRVPPSKYCPSTVCADEEFLPFTKNSFDLILSCLEWECTNDLPGTFAQSLYALRSNGVIMVAFLGENSLWQLKEIFNTVGLLESQSFSPRFSPMLSVNVVAQLLQRAGFSLPNADIDHLTIYYQSFMEILRSLQQGVATNLTYERNKNPLSKSFLLKCSKLYLDRFNTSQGLPLSFDIIYGTGIKLGKI